MNKAAIYGIIGAAIAIGIAAAAVSAPTDGPADMDTNMQPEDAVPTTPENAEMIDDVSETVDEDAGESDGSTDVDSSAASSDTRMIDVGVLIPVTGDLASYGIDTKYGLDMAVDHFNEYLQDKGADWRMRLVSEDTQTNPITALEKTQSLDSKGIKYILGPSSSAEIRNIMAYVNSNNMLLVSPSSTSPKLAIPGDNIFRFVPDDSKQGNVIAALLEDRGIKAIVTVYRGDIWGDGLFETTKTAFEERGGIVAEGIRYNPEVTTFSSEMNVLSKLVAQLSDTYEHGEVGVLLISFDEASHLFNSAIEYEDLRSIPWIGSEGVTGAHTIIDDERAAKFAESTELMALQFSASDNEVFKDVRDEFEERSGVTPNNNYVYASYDSLWALGLAMESAGFDVQDIIEQLPNTVMGHTGALGDVMFNEAGDLDVTDYEFLVVSDGEWMPAARYNAATGEIMDYHG